MIDRSDDNLECFPNEGSKYAPRTWGIAHWGFFFSKSNQFKLNKRRRQFGRGGNQISKWKPQNKNELRGYRPEIA